MENSLAVPRAGQQTAITWPNNSTQKAYAQEYVHKKLVLSIHLGIIHSSQKVETLQMSINWWMNQLEK